MRTLVSPVGEVMPIGDGAFVVTESARTEEEDSCVYPEVPTLVISSFSVSGVTSEVVSISDKVLLRFGGELVSGSELVSNSSVVFTGPKVRSDVTGREEEGMLSGNVEETGEGDVIAGEDSKEGTELVSSAEGWLVHGTSPGVPLIRVVISECENP